MATKTPVRLSGPANLSNSAATKYTCPADTRAILRYVHLSNPSGSPVAFTLSVGADAAGTRVYDGVVVEAGSVFERHVFIPLAEGEEIQAFAGTNNVTRLTLGGTEEAE